MLLLTPIIWLWSMAAMVVAVRQVLDYSETFKAVIVVLIGFVVFLVFWGTIWPSCRSARPWLAACSGGERRGRPGSAAA